MPKTQQKKTGRRVWGGMETLCLVDIWRDRNIEDELSRIHRNQPVMDRVARELCEKGYERSGNQVRIKIKALRLWYKDIKDREGKTGQAPVAPPPGTNDGRSFYCLL